MNEISKNLENVKQRIAISAKKAGKTLDEITLVAVSKTMPVNSINEAIEAGVINIGENRVQEAMEKFPKITKPITKHMIGHLQKNKVKHTVKLFDIIQSVDSLELAYEISKRATKEMQVLVEVNTSGESSKYGCEPLDALTLSEKISSLKSILLKGYMTIAIFSSNINKVRPCFKLLSEIYEEAKSRNIPNTDISILSMGMSSDFEVAIEEGSNMVRVGTSIFGPRKYN